jgi:hypothetical protein
MRRGVRSDEPHTLVSSLSQRNGRPCFRGGHLVVRAHRGHRSGTGRAAPALPIHSGTSAASGSPTTPAAPRGTAAQNGSAGPARSAGGSAAPGSRGASRSSGAAPSSRIGTASSRVGTAPRGPRFGAGSGPRWTAGRAACTGRPARHREPTSGATRRCRSAGPARSGSARAGPAWAERLGARQSACASRQRGPTGPARPGPARDERPGARQPAHAARTHRAVARTYRAASESA